MFALISPVCANPIGSYHYCIIDSGKSQCTNCTRFRNDFCAGYLFTANKARQDRQRAYVPWYTYTNTLVPLPLYPWYPMPTTYIHTCINTFVLFIYLFILLSLSLFILLSLSLLLLSSLLLSPLVLSLPLARPVIGQGQQVLSFLCVLMFYFI